MNRLKIFILILSLAANIHALGTVSAQAYIEWIDGLRSLQSLILIEGGIAYDSKQDAKQTQDKIKKIKGFWDTSLEKSIENFRAKVSIALFKERYKEPLQEANDSIYYATLDLAVLKNAKEKLSTGKITHRNLSDSLMALQKNITRLKNVRHNYATEKKLIDQINIQQKKENIDIEKIDAFIDDMGKFLNSNKVDPVIEKGRDLALEIIKAYKLIKKDQSDFSLTLLNNANGKKALTELKKLIADNPKLKDELQKITLSVGGLGIKELEEYFTQSYESAAAKRVKELSTEIISYLNSIAVEDSDKRFGAMLLNVEYAKKALAEFKNLIAENPILNYQLEQLKKEAAASGIKDLEEYLTQAYEKAFIGNDLNTIEQKIKNAVHAIPKTSLYLDLILVCISGYTAYSSLINTYQPIVVLSKELMPAVFSYKGKKLSPDLNTKANAILGLNLQSIAQQQLYTLIAKGSPSGSQQYEFLVKELYKIDKIEDVSGLLLRAIDAYLKELNINSDYYYKQSIAKINELIDLTKKLAGVYKEKEVNFLAFESFCANIKFTINQLWNKKNESDKKNKPNESSYSPPTSSLNDPYKLLGLDKATNDKTKLQKAFTKIARVIHSDKLIGKDKKFIEELLQDKTKLTPEFFELYKEKLKSLSESKNDIINKEVASLLEKLEQETIRELQTPGMQQLRERYKKEKAFQDQLEAEIDAAYSSQLATEIEKESKLTTANKRTRAQIQKDLKAKVVENILGQVNNKEIAKQLKNKEEANRKKITAQVNESIDDLLARMATDEAYKHLQRLIDRL